MSSSIADHEIDRSLEPSEPLAKDDAAKVSGDPGAGTDDAAHDSDLTASTGDDPASDYFPDMQETVISKNPPLVVGSSKPADVTIIRGGPKELGNALRHTSLEHFDLEEFVGGGGMGAVFRAVDTKLSRTVAVKVLSHDRTDEETRQRFQNEAQNAARLDHENIARVYHVGEDRGLHYIVFEFIEGINIRDLVAEKGALPLGEAISYILQVAEALQHASQRDVVHRDIKPSNVLITAKGRAKLVDMGLARLHHMESDSEDLTASGVTLGTFDYISPEQARDPRLADVRSDLYSLGCTFYFMLTERPPFPEGTVLQKLLSHSSEEPPDPRLARPDLDEEVVNVISKLLAKQPDQRYQQASELAGELLLVARRLNLSSISSNGTVWVTPRRSKFSLIERSLPLVLPVVALLVAAFALDRIWSDATPTDFEPIEVKLDEPIETPRAETPTLPSPTDVTVDSDATADPQKTEDGDTEIQAIPDAVAAPVEMDVAAPKATVEDTATSEDGSANPVEPKESPARPDSSAEPPAKEPSPESSEKDAASPAATPSATGEAKVLPPKERTEAAADAVDPEGAVEEQ